MKSLTPQQITHLQKKFSTAQQARLSGNHAQAERLYRDILAQAPEAWDVQEQLALLLATTNRPQEACKHFRLIVKANPTHAPSHANLANALAESGKLDEAIIEFRRALTLNTSLTSARIAMAETLRRSGRYEEAIIHYKEVLDQNRTHHGAFNGLGLVYRDIDDLPRALECFQHAVGVVPNNPEYRMNFGMTLRRYKLDDLAAKQFFEAASLKPDWLEAVVLLGETLRQQRRSDEAKECFERARQLSPHDPELVERIGYVYLDMGNAERAMEIFREVLLHHPERYMAMLGLGRSHMEAGYSTEAAATFESFIELYPEDSSGYFNLAASRKFKPEDPLIPRLQALAKKITDEDRAAIALNFALGKIYDDCNQWDIAFKHYARGNRLRNAEYDYSPANEEARFDRLRQIFNREFIANHAELGCASEMPVFIVGMPRSGTTLTEQIISSHPKVVGAGEVVFWSHAPQSVPYTIDIRQEYPECMGMMQVEHAREIAETYISLIRKIAGPGTDPVRITDKMPHNFVQLGLIALLFPKARIIHCKRDAMDTCLSIFFQNFGGSHSYAYDLASLGHHYRQYEQLMAHWHEIFPNRILDINYEDTIADPEYWSRKLIEHVGLEWDNACLAPHKLERIVKTASHWQVRQPIYKTSVQRWKNYEHYLGPLKAALSN